jgi:hypothetical protein
MSIRKGLPYLIEANVFIHHLLLGMDRDTNLLGFGLRADSL